MPWYSAEYTIEYDSTRTALLVSNERGRRFAIDLATPAVRELPAGPAK